MVRIERLIVVLLGMALLQAWWKLISENAIDTIGEA
jgi:hypothetical protein